MLKLVINSRKEEGCIEYELHQDNEDESIFLFYEKWKSKALWQVHLKTEVLKLFLKKTKGMISDMKINEMTRLEIK